MASSSLTVSTARSAVVSSRGPWHSATPRRPAFTHLHQSILDMRHQQVQYLVNRYGAALDIADLFGRTPLTLACLLTSRTEAMKMVKILLLAGFNMHHRDLLGRTALVYAVINEHENIVRHLVEADITSLRTADNEMNTPLLHAAATGNAKLVKFLVDAYVKNNLSVDQCNNVDCTAFLAACKNAHYTAAYFIYEIGKASVTVRDGEMKRTPLQWIRENTKLVLNETRKHEPKSHMGEVWAHSSPEPFNRDETLSAHYRQRTLALSCRLEKKLLDPFQIPARLHHSRVTFCRSETNLTSQVAQSANKSEKSDETGEAIQKAFPSERKACNMLLASLEDVERRIQARNLRRNPQQLRLPSAKLIQRQPKSKNLSTKEALHTLLDLYGGNWQLLRQSFSNSVSQVELYTGSATSRL